MASDVKVATCSVESVEWLVECVGHAFVRYLCEIHSIDDSAEVNDDEEREDVCQIEVDVEYLKRLDPKFWKDQDHYAVLGLKDVRHKAKASDIKNAYRQMVLNHHPDKRKAKGEKVDQDSDYFTCITAAWDILGDPVKRRSYDSVDPYFDNDVPSASQVSDDNDFFKVFGEAFSRNSRWSEKRPVPQLGKMNDPRESVERFYSFWYNFESWREYSYEDEESKEKGQDRDERRWIEKQNKAVRAKKKKEELARIRSLVDAAYAADPRIKRFLQEDKDKKTNQKKAKAEAARARQEEMERARRAEEDELRRRKEEEEAAERAKQEAVKAERELAKKILKREKKIFRDLCKANNYFIENLDDEADMMKGTSLLAETLGSDELKELNGKLKSGGGRTVIRSKVAEVEQKIERERINSTVKSSSKENGPSDGKDSWTESQMALLIKGVNIFPAGTNQRWEVVANFINQHSKPDNLKTAKQVLIKAKELQSETANELIKKSANLKAYEAFERDKRSSVKVDVVEASQRVDEGPPWTAEEQKLLEQALKTYPASTPDRWDAIASCLPTRSKKDCMKRYKELVEMVKAKKLATKV